MNLKTAVKKLSTSLVFAAATIAVPMALSSLSTSIGSSVTFGGVALAQDSSEKAETRVTPAMSEAMFKKFGKVQELSSPEDKSVEPDLQAALAELDKIRDGCEKCNKYELAIMYQYYGFLYFAVEQPQRAIEAYENLLAQSPEIPLGLELDTMYRIAQLNFVEENYPEALKWLNDWMKEVDSITADAYYIRSQIYYQTGDNAKSLADVSRAVSMTEQKGDVPREEWYNLQRALYIDKEDYQSGIGVLEKLIVHYPKVGYWRQLSQLYGAVGRESDQLYVLDALHVAGLLENGADLKNLALLLLSEQVPYKGAKILEKAIDEELVEDTSRNLEILSQALRMAQEIKRSIPVMARAAAKADTGELYSQLAAIYLDADENQKAIDAAKSARELGEVRRPGNLYIVKGTAHFNLEEYDEAIKAFEEAAKIKEPGIQNYAGRWLDHVEIEKRRAERLKESAEAATETQAIPVQENTLID